MRPGKARIAVIGGGAWGTALGNLEAKAGRRVRLYARSEATVRAIRTIRCNPDHLPDVELDPRLEATSDLAEAVEDADLVLLVVPAQSLRAVVPDLLRQLRPGIPIVVCAKGIERGSGLFASQIVAANTDGARIAVLSGPSFAADVARGLPTAVTLAARDGALADDLSRILSTDTFRTYASTDVIGVEAGGALKNILAIAAGAVAGRGLGASAGAAMVTRGFVELRRLGEALGAVPDTLMGLSGLGDLVLTCSSERSRNFAYGLALGRGQDPAGLKLAEGVFSAGIAETLAADRGIDAPIIATVAAVLSARLSVGAAVETLLARPLRREMD